MTNRHRQQFGGGRGGGGRVGGRWANGGGVGWGMEIFVIVSKIKIKLKQFFSLAYVF